jgi:hypothetical protein
VFISPCSSIIHGLFSFVLVFDWEANVTPIQKKGPKNLVENGFRKGKSCATQLMEVLDNWTEQLDNRNAKLKKKIWNLERFLEESHLSLLYTPSLYHLLKRFVFCLSETL